MDRNWNQLEAALTQEVYSSAWRYCLRLCSSREDAEDLLQDCLIHANRKLPQLRDRARFRAWLLAIIRTQFINRAGRRLTDALPLWYELPQLSDLPSPLAETVAAAVARLPQAQREVIEFFYFEELRLAEVSQVLRIPVSSARQRLFRARESLRRRLEIPALQSEGEIS